MNARAAAHKMPLAVHIVPYDGVGGVEAAARTLEDGDHEGLVFKKHYLVASHAATSARWKAYRLPENQPWTYVSSTRKLLMLKPDLVIASLWRSCLPLLAVRLLRPRTCAVTFLHSAMDVHWVDRIVNRLAMVLSDEIWADSQSTLDARVPGFLRRRARVISLRLDAPQRRTVTQATPDFLFWGRLHWQKGLMQAMHIFALIHKEFANARFHVIGPNAGEQQRLAQEAAALGIQDAIQFLGPMGRTDIFNYARRHGSFYLQTSVQEGMAISVVEAMQLGIVPIVTPAGEIGSYCQDDVNAILVRSDAEAAARVVELLRNPSAYQQMADAAASTWEDRPLYRDDVLAACLRLLNPAT